MMKNGERKFHILKWKLLIRFILNWHSLDYCFHSVINSDILICQLKFCISQQQGENDTDEQNQYESDADDSDHKLHQNIAPQYERIIAIRAGKPKGGLSSSLKVEVGIVKRLSLSEQALEKAALSYGTDVVRYLLCSPGVSLYFEYCAYNAVLS